MLRHLGPTASRKNRPESAASTSSAEQDQPPAQPPRPPTKPPRPSWPVEDVPVLDRDEQSFLENLTLQWGASDSGQGLYESDDDRVTERPPLPPRIKTPELTWDSDSESFVRGEKLVAVDNDVLMPAAKKDAGGVSRRLATLFGSHKKGHNQDKAKHERQHPTHLAVPGQVGVAAAAAASPDNQVAAVSASEEEREREDLARVLDDLDFGKERAKDPDQDKDDQDSKKHSKTSKFAVSLSAESTELVRRFVVVLKDLVRGVPTAADDLKSLLDDRDGTLARGFERLPSSLRKLVAQLPAKLTSSLAPELLATAATSAGVEYSAEKDGAGARSAAKTLLLPLLTKPSALVKMLKAIMNALKLRWPAFIGTSAIWSVALFCESSRPLPSRPRMRSNPRA